MSSPKVLLIPLLVAVAVLVACVVTIAPERNGPGAACDEAYHLNQGKQLVTALRHQGLGFFLPRNIERNFDWPADGAPVQAPLGHWILGATHWLLDPAPDDAALVSIGSARFAPAVAFALLVLIVGGWTGRREGMLAGGVAAAAVALAPRLFAHAHLASLDLLTTLFFVAAVLAVAEAVRGGRLWQFAAAGVVWGGAMLVRLHGLLVAPPVLLWLLWHFWRSAKRSTAMEAVDPSANGSSGRPEPPAPCFVWPFLKAATAWAVAGAATLFVGWPWLWLAPIAHFRQYLSSGSLRQPIHVFYWGQVWCDRDVPWHYPWVIFAVTVPIGLLALGAIGVWTATTERRRKDAGTGPTFRRPLNDVASHAASEDYVLVLASMAFLLALFSWPGVPVYDGERLFLMVYPFWAILVGVGARRLAGGRLRADASVAAGTRRDGIRGPRPRLATAFVLVLIAAQGVGVVRYHPYQLSYYNLLVGGLAGAERLGFEVTYWGDSVREPMLDEAARRSPDRRPVLLVPSLAPYQAGTVELASPALQTAGVHLVGSIAAGENAARRPRYAVVYHRRADMAAIGPLLVGSRVVMESTLQGVWLARLVELAPAPPDRRGS
ncbi:MAG: glycosyltransferase family 39 protein [Thermoguttaceae bacterium]